MKNIVFSNSINAWSIKKGLRLLSEDLEVHTPSKTKYVINHTINHIPKNSKLFFTEESSLKKFLNRNPYQFYPDTFSVNLLDDKYNFAEFLLRIGEKPIPYGTVEDYMKYPFYLKAKHSWINDTKLPRGYICETKEAFDEKVKKIENKKMKKEWFFKQKLLTSPVENNISTSGFFDYKHNNRNIIIVTKKTLGTGGRITDGAVVETIRDPSELISRACNILNSLEYQGPFELEFFYEESDNTYYVLELNPRFWLQHGIFINHYDNAILKRYLNLDTEKEWYENGIPEFQKVVWINNVYYFKALIKGNKNFIKSIRELSGDKVFYPSNIATLFYYKNMLLRKIKKNK